MAAIPGRVDGRYVGVAVVSSEGAWSDLTAAGLTSVTGEAIPENAAFIDVVVRETSGDTPCYLLLRSSDDESTDDAIMIGAGEVRAFGLAFDVAVTSLSLYGEARIEAGVL